MGIRGCCDWPGCLGDSCPIGGAEGLEDKDTDELIKLYHKADKSRESDEKYEEIDAITAEINGRLEKDGLSVEEIEEWWEKI